MYNRSNGQYVIGSQDCDSLKIVMRSVFLQYSANQPGNITQQITDLNKIYLKKNILPKANGRGLIVKKEVLL